MPIEELKRLCVWLCWKRVSKNGRLTKQPFSISGRAIGTSEEYRTEWVTFDEATAALRQPGSGFDGIGFVMPEGIFLLDVDHINKDDPKFAAIHGLFHTYTEISPSGNGYHIYGRADLSRIPKAWDAQEGCWKLDSKYYVKNSSAGLELYIGGLTNRFATFTGNTVDTASEVMDCTDAVLTFLENYMRRPVPSTITSATDAEKYIVLSEDAIPTILDELRNQKNGAKFARLFDNGDTTGYGSASEADAALCAMIAFRAGPNPDLIDTIFRQSALYREKWERSDYSSSTIATGIRACRGVFHRSLLKRPPFILSDGKKLFVHPTLLADHVRSHLRYIFVREAQRGTYSKYVYQDGVYQHYSDDMFKGAIKAFVAEYDPMLLKMSVIDEAFKQLSTDLDYIPQTALNADENLINFQNGLLDIRSLALRPHDPSVITTIQIPCEWKPVPSPTPVFDKYLATISDGSEETQALLLEFMGAAISNVPGYRMKKALFLHGQGDTGKSQLKRLTERLLGPGNYTGIDLAQMEARFGTSAIYGKRLAGSSDMSFMTVNELKTFKKVTGGDALFAEFKGQDSFEFVYNGLLWFCMNELPKFGGDDGTWVFERILPVYCPNVIPKSEQDAKLLDKMYEERQGIVYKAVMAIKDVIDRGYRFTETQEIKEARAEYRIENNTALEFFHTCMKQRKHAVRRDDPFTVKKVYTAYCRWYDANYGKQYRKTKKEFYSSIADSLGLRYEDMTVENAKGTVLRDYCPNPDAWEEFDLSDEVFGAVRQWVA